MFKKFITMFVVPFMLSSFPLFMISCLYNKGPQPVDCNVNPVVIQSLNTTDASCGVGDGTLQITANGGNGEYLYSIDGAIFQDSGKFLNLITGSYNVTVKDGNDCSVSGSAIVGNNTGFSISVNATESGCGISSGSLTVSPTGGIEPIEYKIEGQPYQSSNIISGLTSGTYDVLARDSIGCETIIQAKIVTNISLNDDIMPILAANCAVSGCHDGASGIPDWKIKSNVINKSSTIKQKTSSGAMPPNGSITNDEIQTIACWVNDGAKNN